MQDTDFDDRGARRRFEVDGDRFWWNNGIFFERITLITRPWSLGSSANVANLNEEVSCAIISFIKGTAL